MNIQQKKLLSEISKELKLISFRVASVANNHSCLSVDENFSNNGWNNQVEQKFLDDAYAHICQLQAEIESLSK